MISELTICGFRGFATRQTLKLACPTGVPGSGLTIVTGPNNSGKSSIGECFQFISSSIAVSFGYMKRNSIVDEVEVEVVVNGAKNVFRSLRKGSSETEWKTGGRVENCYIVPSRRAIAEQFGRNIWDRDTFVSNHNSAAYRQGQFEGFTYRLFNAEKHKGRFDTVLERLLGTDLQWTLDQHMDGQYFIRLVSGASVHTGAGSGDGVINLFVIADALYDSKPGDVVIIDEPELSLHPAVLKRVANELREQSAEKQVVVITHSPYLIDIAALLNGGVLARCVKQDGGTVVHHLADEGRSALRSLDGNLNFPHSIGLQAKEVFYLEDGVVVTEGQEDVVLLPQALSDAGLEFTINLYGWGAGGAGSIQHICTILRELGFKRVVGVFDADKRADSLEAAKKFPHYCFVCIPADDIRTKRNRGKIGLLDEEYKLRPEFRDEFIRVMESVRAYIS